MTRRAIEIDGGTVLAYGHYGRPVVAFPSENGEPHDWESQGMVDAIGELLDGGKVKLYCVPSFDRESWTRNDLQLEEIKMLMLFYAGAGNTQALHQGFELAKERAKGLQAK